MEIRKIILLAALISIVQAEKNLALENHISIHRLYELIKGTVHGQKMCRVKFSKGKF